VVNSRTGSGEYKNTVNRKGWSVNETYIRPVGPSSWKLNGKGDSEGTGGRSWMLPHPETICQLP